VFSIARLFALGLLIWTPWKDIYTRLPKRCEAVSDAGYGGQVQAQAYFCFIPRCSSLSFGPRLPDLECHHYLRILAVHRPCAKAPVLSSRHGGWWSAQPSGAAFFHLSA